MTSCDELHARAQLGALALDGGYDVTATAAPPRSIYAEHRHAHTPSPRHVIHGSNHVAPQRVKGSHTGRSQRHAVRSAARSRAQRREPGAHRLRRPRRGAHRATDCRGAIAKGSLAALVGGAFVQRGATGHCMVYDALGVSTGDADAVLGKLARDVTGAAATVNARKAVKVERSVTIDAAARASCTRSGATSPTCRSSWSISSPCASTRRPARTGWQRRRRAARSSGRPRS